MNSHRLSIWLRLSPRRRHELRDGRDAGISLVEILVALSLITVGVLGLLGELATNIKQQHLEKTQATAVHLASGTLESARAESFSSLLAEPSTTSWTTPVKGVSYTQVATVQVCSPTDSPNTCTTPASGATKTVHAGITVTWTANGTSHTVKMARSISDNSSTTISSSSSPLGSCGGGGTTLVSGHLSLSPATVSVDASGHPTSDVVVTLTQTGLSNTTCVPLTWSDDSGSHQLTMTGSGGTYSVTVPKASITRSGLTSAGSVAFTATVPGTQAVPSVSLTILGQPTFGTCSVQVAGLGLNVITLKLLSRNTALAATVTCTTTNLSSTDSVIATYASGTGTQNLTMTSASGTTWTATLAQNSVMVNSGLNEAFTFKLTRAADSATATKSLTATLA